MPNDEIVLRFDKDEAGMLLGAWQECQDARDFACRVLGAVMNAIMDEQAQEACGAGRNERTEARTNSRNGYRQRTLTTALGDVELDVPKLRRGSFWPEGLIGKWSRMDTSVAAVVMEMYRLGVSTRKVERVARSLGVDSISSSEVSRLCSELDEEVRGMRERDLSGTPCCYVWLDATYLSCREGSAYVSRGMVTAIGMGADGRKHLLGAAPVETESEDSWDGFLSGLVARGLTGVRLVVSDDHRGLVAAIRRNFQGCSWQRCVVHLQRNLASAMAGRPEAERCAVRDLVRAATATSDRELARHVWDEAAPLVRSMCPRAGEVFASARDSALAYLPFPRAHWPKLRSNNLQERTNREIKRRASVVGSFPSEASMVRLVCASLIGEEDGWLARRMVSERSARTGLDPGLQLKEEGRDPEMTAERRAALERRAREVVADVMGRYGIGME